MEDQIEGQIDVDEAIAAAAAEAPAQEQLDPSAIDQLTDEQAAELGAVQIEIPMMTIPLSGGALRVVPGENGTKTLFIGPIGITFALPLSDVGVKHLVSEFTGGIEIATEIPKLEVVR